MLGVYLLQVSLVQKEKDSLLILEGPVDERAGPVFTALIPQIKASVFIDFEKVEYFNSLGIRTWVNFLRVLRDGRQIYYDNCPIELIQQINMMPAISQGVEIRTIVGDFFCKNCGNEMRSPFSCQIGKAKMIECFSQQKCDRCGSLMHFEEDPESLLMFLKIP